MKILHVIPFFSPKFGGSVTVCYELSKELVRHNHDVTVITTDFGFDMDYADSIRAEKVDVIPFHNLVNFGLFLYSPSMKKWLKKNLHLYDVIHLHNYRSYQNNIVCKYAKKFNVPYVVQPHGSLPRLVEKKGLKKFYDLVWGNNILKCASNIIAVSGSEVEQFRQVGIPDEMITVIPNGVTYISPTDLPPAGQFREQYGIHEKHIILYVGRIHKIKGIDFLIRAFNSFHQTCTGDDVALIIVGPDDGYQPVIEDLVEQLGLSAKVKFIGYISPLADAYQDANVLVYPSIYEIFGLVPFEALLCGTPVIVTDDCGCGEIIEKAQCGYLVKYDDINDLEEKIRITFSDFKKNKEMIKNGQNYIKNELNWDNLILKFEDVYKNVINFK